jgi:hypothetical protein
MSSPAPPGLQCQIVQQISPNGWNSPPPPYGRCVGTGLTMRCNHIDIKNARCSWDTLILPTPSCHQPFVILL